MTHIAGELLNIMAGIKLVDVPYPGSAQALTDALSGRIPLLMAPVSSVVQQIANGELKALAVAGAQRASIAPEIPTMAEAGLPGYDLDLWFGLLAPAGTPPSTLANSPTSPTLRSKPMTSAGRCGGSASTRSAAVPRILRATSMPK